MKIRFPLGVLLGLALSGCRFTDLGTALINQQSSDGGRDGGLSPSDAGATACFLSSPCTPWGAVDACTGCGLICDESTASCRLPARGEPCIADGGCGTSNGALGCYNSSVDSVPETVCEIACTNGDSSNCPYGTSCGDPNLPNFCSPAGSAGCVAWSSCSLGGGVLGTCAPTGTGTTCLATGTQTEAYAPCDPEALNNDAANLCAVGSACVAVPLMLGGPAIGGFCFPMCSNPQTPCLSEQTHCEQPSPTTYGICRPGNPCTLGPYDTCPAETVCVPDTASSLSGGCLQTDSSSAPLSGSCTPQAEVAEVSPCAFGTCLPTDGGYACTALCNLADGGEPYCVRQVCAPLAANDAADQIGACR